MAVILDKMFCGSRKRSPTLDTDVKCPADASEGDSDCDVVDDKQLVINTDTRRSASFSMDDSTNGIEYSAHSSERCSQSSQRSALGADIGSVAVGGSEPTAGMRQTHSGGTQQPPALDGALIPHWLAKADKDAIAEKYNSIVATLQRSERRKERTVAYVTPDCEGALALCSALTRLKHDGIVRVLECRELAPRKLEATKKDDCRERDEKEEEGDAETSERSDAGGLMEVMFEDVDGEWLLDYACRVAKEENGVLERSVMAVMSQVIDILQALHSERIVALDVSPRCFKVVGDRVVLCRLQYARPVSDSYMEGLPPRTVESLWSLSPDAIESLLRASGQSLSAGCGARVHPIVAADECKLPPKDDLYTQYYDEMHGGLDALTEFGGDEDATDLSAIAPETAAEMEQRAKYCGAALQCSGLQLKALDIWQVGVLTFLLLTSKMIHSQSLHLVKCDTRMTNRVKELLLDLLEPHFESRYFTFQSVADCECLRPFQQPDGGLRLSPTPRTCIGGIHKQDSAFDSASPSPKVGGGFFSCGFSRRKRKGRSLRRSAAGVYPEPAASKGTTYIQSFETADYIANLRAHQRKHRQLLDTQMRKEREEKEVEWSKVQLKLPLSIMQGATDSQSLLPLGDVTLDYSTMLVASSTRSLCLTMPLSMADAKEAEDATEAVAEFDSLSADSTLISQLSGERPQHSDLDDSRFLAAGGLDSPPQIGSGILTVATSDSTVAHSETLTADSVRLHSSGGHVLPVDRKQAIRTQPRTVGSSHRIESTRRRQQHTGGGKDMDVISSSGMLMKTLSSISGEEEVMPLTTTATHSAHRRVLSGDSVSSAGFKQQYILLPLSSMAHMSSTDLRTASVRSIPPPPKGPPPPLQLSPPPATEVPLPLPSKARREYQHSRRRLSASRSRTQSRCESQSKSKSSMRKDKTMHRYATRSRKQSSAFVRRSSSGVAKKRHSALFSTGSGVAVSRGPKRVRRLYSKEAITPTADYSSADSELSVSATRRPSLSLSSSSSQSSYSSTTVARPARIVRRQSVVFVTTHRGQADDSFATGSGADSRSRTTHRREGHRQQSLRSPQCDDRSDKRYHSETDSDSSTDSEIVIV